MSLVFHESFLYKTMCIAPVSTIYRMFPARLGGFLLYKSGTASALWCGPGFLLSTGFLISFIQQRFVQCLLCVRLVPGAGRFRGEAAPAPAFMEPLSFVNGAHTPVSSQPRFFTFLLFLESQSLVAWALPHMDPFLEPFCFLRLLGQGPDPSAGMFPSEASLPSPSLSIQCAFPFPILSELIFPTATSTLTIHFEKRSSQRWPVMSYVFWSCSRIITWFIHLNFA